MNNFKKKLVLPMSELEQGDLITRTIDELRDLE